MQPRNFFPVLALLAAPSFAQELDNKIRGDLGTVLFEAPADQRIPVTIVLESHARPAELYALSSGLDKADRRALTVSHLKQVAADTQAGLLEFLADRGATGVRSFWIHNMIGAEVTPAVIQELAGRVDVSYVHREVRAEVDDVLTALPAALPMGDPTCGLDLIGAPQVWSQRGINGAGVTVAVIDTGLCAGHNDITNRVWRNFGEIPGNGVDDDQNGFVDDVRGWNFEANNGDIKDLVGHGSHVSGTVAGDGTGGTAAGVAPGARIMTCKFFNSFAGEQSVWDSLQYAVDNGADISTASLGWPHGLNPDRATWRMVCDNAIATGLVVIFSAGNEGGSINNPTDVRTPGDVPDVLCVGSVNCNDQLSGFSSRGPTTWENVAPYNDHPFPPGLVKPDIVAEGDSTVSHNLCSGYLTLAGTSMATPHVAGAAALLLQADPSLDHFGVKALLEGTAIDLGAAGKDNRFGAGRIDCLAAVDAALTTGNFCEPKVTSCGPVPTIWTAGNPRVSNTSGFTVNAANLPANTTALMIYSDQGSDQIPLLGGNLCLASVIRTIPVTTSTSAVPCDAVATLDMTSFATGALGGSPASFLSIPGVTIHCQWWCRDTPNSFGVVLTPGVSYTTMP